MIKKLVYLVLAVGAVAFWCYTHSDRAKIARLFDTAASLAVREPSESVMEGAVKAQTLAGFFAATCNFDIPELGVKGSLSNNNIEGGILIFRNGATTLRVVFDELDIYVFGTAAHVEGVADLSGSDERIQLNTSGKRNFSADLTKNEQGEWKFSAISLPEI